MSQNIKLSLRANNKKLSNNKLYDWYTPHQIKKSEIFTGKTLIQYSHNTLIFKKACRESANKTIPLKQKRSKYLPWKSTDIFNKRDKLYAAAEKMDIITNYRKH